MPREVWIAIPHKARKPRLPDLPVLIYRFSGPMLRYGIETRIVDGIPIRIASPARTVVDCFRYRNKVGLDVALEALRDAFEERKADMGEIHRAAGMCRAKGIIFPSSVYLRLKAFARAQGIQVWWAILDSNQ